MTDAHRIAVPKRVSLITGASSGFGEACARHLAAKDYRVFGTSRNASFDPPGRPSSQGAPYRMIPMDVRDTVSVQRGIDVVLQETGRIDAVVCNAGYGVAGSVEDTTVEEAQQQLDTNFFGVWRVCRAVIPHMRRQGGGYLVIVSSLAGLMGIPFQAAYSASKFALEGMAEALRMEVKPWGIKVVLIEPGDFRTRFTQNRISAAAVHHSVYAAAFRHALSVMEEEERRGPPPDRVAHLLERIIRHPSPRLRYTVGSPWQRSGALLKRFLPGRFFEWLMISTYKLH
jgi:NAD(P)-dependent dehydrogenase (short-subunit alcohol dehydrogenase family)